MTRVGIFCSTLLAVASLVFADEPTTIVSTRGERFEKAVISSFTPSTATISHAGGVARLPWTELPPELRQQYGYDPEAAARFEKAEAERAHRAAAEKELAEKQRTIAKWSAEQAEWEKKQRTIQDAIDIGKAVEAGFQPVYDPSAHRWYYSPTEASAAREAAMRAAAEAKANSRR